MARKNLNITLPEELIIELKVYALKHGNNNVSRLIEEMIVKFLGEKGEEKDGDAIDTDSLEEDARMRIYRVERVQYRRDLDSLMGSWTELETHDKEEAIKCFEELKNEITSGGVILNKWDQDSQEYVWMDEYNLDLKKFEESKLREKEFNEDTL